jgi:hypothetical protein
VITRPAPLGSRLGFALVTVPIGAWIVHLTFSAAAVRFTCSHHEWRWILYAVTVVTGAVALAGVALSARLVRATGGREDGDRDVDQLAFLARVGVFVGVINLVLIVAEGILVPFLSSCA